MDLGLWVQKLGFRVDSPGFWVNPSPSNGYHKVVIIAGMIRPWYLHIIDLTRV